MPKKRVKRNYFTSHLFLQIRVLEILKKKGFISMIEKKLGEDERKGGRIDVYGYKSKGEKNFRVGVECLTNFNEWRIQQKIDLYKGYFDKLIFCLPTRDYCFLFKRIKNIRNKMRNVEKYKEKIYFWIIPVPKEKDFIEKYFKEIEKKHWREIKKNPRLYIAPLCKR